MQSRATPHLSGPSSCVERGRHAEIRRGRSACRCAGKARRVTYPRFVDASLRSGLGEHRYLRFYKVRLNLAACHGELFLTCRASRSPWNPAATTTTTTLAGTPQPKRVHGVLATRDRRGRRYVPPKTTRRPPPSRLWRTTEMQSAHLARSTAPPTLRQMRCPRTRSEIGVRPCYQFRGPDANIPSRPGYPSSLAHFLSIAECTPHSLCGSRRPLVPLLLPPPPPCPQCAARSSSPAPAMTSLCLARRIHPSHASPLPRVPLRAPRLPQKLLLRRPLRTDESPRPAGHPRFVVSYRALWCLASLRAATPRPRGTSPSPSPTRTNPTLSCGRAEVSGGGLSATPRSRRARSTLHVQFPCPSIL